jgi:hypothetical protein
MLFKHWIACIGLAASLAACAGPHAGGTYQTKASSDRLYNAALDAVSSIGYSVTTSNKADGFIVASQGVIMGKGSSVGLNAHVSDDGAYRSLVVNLTAPPGTMALGPFSENLTDYINAVKTRIPDLMPVQ